MQAERTAATAVTFRREPLPGSRKAQGLWYWRRAVTSLRPEVHRRFSMETVIPSEQGAAQTRRNPVQVGTLGSGLRHLVASARATADRWRAGLPYTARASLDSERRDPKRRLPQRPHPKRHEHPQQKRGADDHGELAGPTFALRATAGKHTPALPRTEDQQRADDEEDYQFHMKKRAMISRSSPAVPPIRNPQSPIRRSPIGNRQSTIEGYSISSRVNASSGSTKYSISRSSSSSSGVGGGGGGGSRLRCGAATARRRPPGSARAGSTRSRCRPG